MKTLTKMQVKKLLDLNNFEPKTYELTGAATNWQLEVYAEYGSSEQVYKLFPGVGGYTTGYGSVVLKPGYKSKGDWNDKSSAWHY
jgi:hypothetical protein